MRWCLEKQAGPWGAGRAEYAPIYLSIGGVRGQQPSGQPSSAPALKLHTGSMELEGLENEGTWTAAKGLSIQDRTSLPTAVTAKCWLHALCKAVQQRERQDAGSRH